MPLAQRTELAKIIASHINAFGSIPQPTFYPEYTARIFTKGEIVRVYIRNGPKDCGNISILQDGLIDEKYAKLGTFGAQLLSDAKTAADT